MTIRQTTRDALAAYVAGCDSLRDAGRRLDVSPSTLSDIQHGRHAHVSARAENKVRLALGLKPLNFRNHNPPRPWISAADLRLLEEAGLSWRQVFDAGMNFVRLLRGQAVSVTVTLPAETEPGYTQLGFPLADEILPPTHTAVWDGQDSA